jgi:hypothetical protein
MPFESCFPRSLTPASIRTNAPAASGIYGISNAREWIYIGASDDIQASLLGCLDDGGSTVMRRQPTGFVFELCAGAGRPRREDRLVREYAPACNQRSGPI